MTIKLHTIKPARGARKKSKRVGRGNATQKGTTAGRGTKGQRARSGGRSRGAIRAFKQSLQKVPKLRGFKSMYPRAATVTLAALQRVSATEPVITPAVLAKRKIIKKAENGVKIVATGEIKNKIMVQGCLASRRATAAIEKAGGKLEF